MDEQINWSGSGKWLSVIAGALMILFSIPDVFANSAAAGWNLFLGLLLIGVTTSGHKAAPKIVSVVAALFLARLLLMPLFGWDGISALFGLILFLMIAWSAVDLRGQSS